VLLLLLLLLLLVLLHMLHDGVVADAAADSDFLTCICACWLCCCFMLFVLQFADAFDAAGMLMLSQLLLLPLLFLFSMGTCML
jgi:hypothetical protein